MVNYLLPRASEVPVKGQVISSRDNLAFGWRRSTRNVWVRVFPCSVAAWSCLCGIVRWIPACAGMTCYSPTAEMFRGPRGNQRSFFAAEMFRGPRGNQRSFFASETFRCQGGDYGSTFTAEPFRYLRGHACLFRRRFNVRCTGVVFATPGIATSLSINHRRHSRAGGNPDNPCCQVH
jgi:hypothetical protein